MAAVSRGDALRRVPWFGGLADDDLDRICRDVSDVSLAPGEVLLREGEPGEHAYVVVSGTVEILKQTGDRSVPLAVRGPGEVFGEMALLQDEPRVATVRAREATDLLAIPRAALDDLLASSLGAARAVMRTLLERMNDTSVQLRHHERMAELGTLTAGVAHELNNPAAAARRDADRLGEVTRQLAGLAAAPPADPRARTSVLALVDRFLEQPPTPLGALARTDAEDEVTDWLADHGITQAASMAAELVDAGVGVTDLAALDAPESADVLDDAVRFLVAVITLAGLARSVGDATTRISTITGALRSHLRHDEAPVQDVDVVRGIEDTLVLLGHRLRDVEVVREIAPDLPRITANGGELNQVWTNLIANALDAMASHDDQRGRLTIRAHRVGDDVAVEVEDDGPGIRPEHLGRVFDAFFTTKPVGHGTGLGLGISRRIVVQHGGDLTVSSRPGRTTFRATLPVSPLQAA